MRHLRKTWMLWLSLVMILILMGWLSPWVYGQFDASKPTNARLYNYRDDDIRTNNTAIQGAFDNEHEFTGTATATQEGFHRAGSAVAQYGSSLALTRPDGTAYDGNDSGRLGVDSDTKQLYVYDHDSAAFLPLEGSYLDVRSFGADDTDDVDDANAIQRAIDAALSQKQPLYIPRTSADDTGYYRLETALTIGSGTTDAGIRIIGDRWPTLTWCGATDANILEIEGMSESTIYGIVIDGNSVSDCNGIVIQTDGSHPSQRNTFDHVWVMDCNSIGISIVQQEGATTDYVTFDQCVVYNNEINMLIAGGVREINWRGGAITNAGTYGVRIDAGIFTGYDAFFGLNETSDIYINGSITSLKLYGGSSESGTILTNSSEAEGGSQLISPILLSGFNQAAVVPDTNVIDYTGWQPIVFVACKFQGNVVLSSNVNGAIAVGCRFYAAGDFVSGTTLTRILEEGIVTTNHVLDIKYAPTITDSDDSDPAALTLTPTTDYVELTNPDSDGCDVTMGETGMQEGLIVTIVNVGAENIDIVDSTGVCELANSTTLTLSTYDNVTLRYIGDRWVQTAASDN